MHFDLVIRAGTVVTGNSDPSRLGDIGISAGKIATIADAGALDGKDMIDAQGRIVTPGFIDIHSHADYTVLLDGRAHSAVMQGVTSLVVGNCGLGIAPVSPVSAGIIAGNAPGWRRDGGLELTWSSFQEYMTKLASSGVGPNVFPLIAHGAMRMAVAGFEDRPLTADEIAQMQAFLKDAMKMGAVGFSTGLEYAPGISSSTDELIALAEAMRGFDGIYATHCRNRSDRMVEATREAIAVARSGQTRLQLSHFIKRPYADPAVSGHVWAEIKRARGDGMTVLADVFPFDYGPTPLSVLLPPSMLSEAGDNVGKTLADPDFRTKVLSSLDGMFGAAVESGLAESMFVACDGADGRMHGKTLPEIAEAQGMSVAEAAYWLLERAGDNFQTVMIVEHWVLWKDLVSALSDPSFLIMGDGATSVLDGPGSQFDMCPSDWGYAPRFLSQFVRDMGLCTIEQAVARMASGPAQQLGLRDRGVIEIGMQADLVVFDLAKVGTRVSPRSLRELPTGIGDVLVNGVPVVRNGEATNALPGTVGRR
ncbi:amidohydrolase family protein [Sphingobium sp. CR2-8]|uniref:N-acyl-D-amino-acid deacylase family protein n=1 Tax=Sphingobium sp. CR2-8 TaxID=1306534 RepID=UPI002DBD7C2B|nr:amidohydrolase family protein [Sphingobium sp. CR2-8]MEC3909449.1 amidohydrolase family protein [Sphingobium sp. CR2-8]